MEANPKKLSKEINNMAESLPEQYEVHQAKVTMTGADVHLSGLDPDGIENTEEEYLLKIPIYIPVNHRRRLNSALKKGGIKGVIRYVNQIYKEAGVAQYGEA